MGRQAKIKAMRREIRKRRKEEQANKMAKHLVQPDSPSNPPDLGVRVKDGVGTSDKFGG